MNIPDALRRHHPNSSSGALLVVSVIILSMVIASPSMSPVASVADFDGDGVPDDEDYFPTDPWEWMDSDGDGTGDFKDAFPNDPGEWSDSDLDGIGDGSDFMIDGNGGFRISLLRFEFEGYALTYHRIKYCPDAWFEIRIDTDCDGEFDEIVQSEIFCSAECLESFFEAEFDINDGLKAIRFSIIVYDVWDMDNNDVTDFEILDYMPTDGVTADDPTVGLPCCSTWTHCGEGDTETPDCYIEFSASTFLIA